MNKTLIFCFRFFSTIWTAGERLSLVKHHLRHWADTCKNKSRNSEAVELRSDRKPGALIMEGGLYAKCFFPVKKKKKGCFSWGWQWDLEPGSCTAGKCPQGPKRYTRSIVYLRSHLSTPMNNAKSRSAEGLQILNFQIHPWKGHSW